MRNNRDILFLPLVNESFGNPNFPIITDPYGSYTGCPSDPEEQPVQDADDL